MQFTVTMTVKATGEAAKMTEAQMQDTIKRMVSKARADAQNTLRLGAGSKATERAVGVVVQSVMALKGV